MSHTYQLNTLSKLPEVAPEGSRLCRVIFKLSEEEKKAGKERKESLGCFLPAVSASFVQAFATSNPDIVADWIQNLQDAAVRATYLKSGRSATDADLTIEALATLYNATTVSDRLTSKQVEAAWSGELGLAFVNFLGKSRNVDLTVPENVEMLTQVKINYLPFISFSIARKPAFDSAAIKEKVTSVFAAFGDYLIEKGIESAIFVRAFEKMIDAPTRTADLNSL